MKTLVVLLIVGILAVIGLHWWFAAGTAADSGYFVPLMCGPGRTGALEVHVAVSTLMTQIEPPRVDMRSGTVYWNEWVDNHFELRDGNGDRVPLQRNNFSSLIPEHQVGTPEFYLIARLAENTDYTIDFIPTSVLKDHYRYEFSTPTDEPLFERVHFQLVKK